MKIDRLSQIYWCFQESLAYISISCYGPDPRLQLDSKFSPRLAAILFFLLLKKFITFGIINNFVKFPIFKNIKKGHKIRVAIAGADKDNFNRIPAQGTPTITVARNKKYSSFIALPVLERNTENISEMKKLERIDCAFLPMNLPYTMNPEMVADAAKAFKTKY